MLKYLIQFEFSFKTKESIQDIKKILGLESNRTKIWKACNKIDIILDGL